MKIVKFIMALSFVCCAMAMPLTASEKSNDYAQLASQVSKLSDKGLSPIVQKLGINFVEKNIKKLVISKEKQIKHIYESIKEEQDYIQYLNSNESGHWDEQDIKESIARSNASIEENYARIPKCQEEIEMYKELLNEVQVLKSAI